MVKKKVQKSKLFSFTKEDFSKENFVEGAIIRPGILFVSFFTFIASLFLFLARNPKWGGSLIIFSFILNLYSSYTSLTDENTIYRTMNLLFKISLLLIEIIAFYYLIIVSFT